MVAGVDQRSFGADDLFGGVAREAGVCPVDRNDPAFAIGDQDGVAAFTEHRGRELELAVLASSGADIAGGAFDANGFAIRVAQVVGVGGQPHFAPILVAQTVFIAVQAAAGGGKGVHEGVAGGMAPHVEVGSKGADEFIGAIAEQLLDRWGQAQQTAGGVGAVVGVLQVVEDGAQLGFVGRREGFDGAQVGDETGGAADRAVGFVVEGDGADQGGDDAAVPVHEFEAVVASITAGDALDLAAQQAPASRVDEIGGVASDEVTKVVTQQPGQGVVGGNEASPRVGNETAVRCPGDELAVYPVPIRGRRPERGVEGEWQVHDRGMRISPNIGMACQNLKRSPRVSGAAVSQAASPRRWHRARVGPAWFML